MTARCHVCFGESQQSEPLSQGICPPCRKLIGHGIVNMVAADLIARDKEGASMTLPPVPVDVLSDAVLNTIRGMMAMFGFELASEWLHEWNAVQMLTQARHRKLTDRALRLLRMHGIEVN